MSHLSQVGELWTSCFRKPAPVSGGNIRAYYVDSDRNRPDPFVSTLEELYELKSGKRHGPTICIVENISRVNAQNLEREWELESSFFKHHFSRIPKEWTSRWPMPRIYNGSQYLGERERDLTGLPGLPEVGTDLETEYDEPMKWDSINGIFEYHGIGEGVKGGKELEPESHPIYSASPNLDPDKRGSFYTEWHGIWTLCSNTRISYYRVDREFYLFVVDAPLYLQHRYRHEPRYLRPTLRLPYVTGWGGILMPLLIAKESGCFSLFESLAELFQYRRQRELLFSHDKNAKGQAFPAPPLCYMMSNSLWLTHLGRFTREIKRINFREIKKRNLEIIGPLHDLREDIIDFINAPLAETRTNVPDSISEFWRELKYSSKISKDVQDGLEDRLASSLKEMGERADKLEELLMHTFQILMSSVSVQDARRVTFLTSLATIFLPLSFVVGIFGMNLKELNGSPLSFRAPLVAAVVTGSIAIIVSLVLREASKIDWTVWTRLLWTGPML